jgi:hypothetical protein
VLGLMEGLSDTGPHPAQIGIGVSYGEGFPWKTPWSVCVVSKQTVRGLARVGLKDACGKTKTRCHQCRKYLQDELSQGMYGVLAR